MTQPHPIIAENPQPEQRTARFVAFVICLALLFDGYDLVVHGVVLPGLLADPTQIRTLEPAVAGLVGSYALLGVLIGSLVCGAAGATMAEFAPAGRRQFFNGIVYSGIPAGGVFAAVMGIVLLTDLGRRGLILIGALPLVLLVPLMLWKLPESPRWLLSRGETERAEAVARRTGVPLIEEQVIQQVGAAPRRTGYAAVFSRQFALASILLGVMSSCGLLLTYGLNTWLAVIMNGYDHDISPLYFVLVLNGSALVGGLLASRLADRTGLQRMIATTFAPAAIALVLMTFSFPLPLLFLFIAVAGVGTIGTQVLVYGFQSNYYTTDARAAGVAFCASTGRFGGIFGPIIGGWLAAAGLGGPQAFHVFAGVALLGALVTLVVPHQRGLEEAEQQVEELAGQHAPVPAEHGRPGVRGGPPAPPTGPAPRRGEGA
ncbi:MFS transporter, partial [Kocuria sp. NPDC057446]|uniref:MFS transporter n=1 Tax=Kocuria sp. NPDC057446 TaxID=3346137 RepID=UPI0036C147CC